MSFVGMLHSVKHRLIDVCKCLSIFKARKQCYLQFKLRTIVSEMFRLRLHPLQLTFYNFCIILVNIAYFCRSPTRLGSPKTVKKDRDPTRSVSTQAVGRYITQSTDNLVMYRKTVKAALVLLPLLGANNILAITGPLVLTPVQYGLWSFASFALTAFQGLLFSLLYCFSNSDVRTISTC